MRKRANQFFPLLMQTAFFFFDRLLGFRKIIDRLSQRSQLIISFYGQPMSVFSASQNFYTLDNYQKQNGPPSKTYCPLCDSALTPGVNLFSKVYRPLTSEIDDDQRCTIQGCPFCYSKDGEKKKRRSCPVCGRSVPMNGSLVAKMTMQKSGRRHVHIIGCTECHKKK